MVDLAVARKRLLEQQRETLSSISDLGGNIDAIVSARQDSNNDDEHDPEGATLAFERSQSDALLRQAEQRLQDIDAALSRVKRRTYGMCVVCGKPIAAARLAARPYASTCIACAG
ncbi:MAG: TraR/DksA C4-type zinc finger protein [Cryobacterium sp.]|nr:TraR/DksA C4-type zinc finger protein [Micrococcales bacterium]MBX3078695.1 TraR/DksA C4-type zinc finger protein [Cryobacterium sp.]MBX3310482.1 TraR/DksA C4-type zinc finger protein [Cryobacterium sp.]MCB1282179.1 TraR/DksA C4-type zinc finger protein [Salinibacterium sp.]